MAGAGAFISEVSRGGVNGALMYACHRWFSKPGRSFISTEVCPKIPFRRVSEGKIWAVRAGLVTVPKPSPRQRH
jgi:hypothetical protein